MARSRLELSERKRESGPWEQVVEETRQETKHQPDVMEAHRARAARVPRRRLRRKTELSRGKSCLRMGFGVQTA
eukprot:233336-Rhodomonas_salina.3